MLACFFTMLAENAGLRGSGDRLESFLFFCRDRVIVELGERLDMADMLCDSDSRSSKPTAAVIFFD